MLKPLRESFKEVMESFFNVKNFKIPKKVMESFFNVKNFESRGNDGVLFQC